jgi:hypothetical protein
MPRVHEVPTHLNVEDTLLGNLTPSQLVRLAVCLSLAYGAWDQLTLLPDPARAVLAGVMVLVGLLGVCWRPDGQSLDAWAVAILTFGLAPRRLVWRRPEPEAAEWRLSINPDWAELDLQLGWSSSFVETVPAVARWGSGSQG